MPMVNISMQFDAGYASDATGAKLGTASFAGAVRYLGYANATFAPESNSQLQPNIICGPTLGESFMQSKQPWLSLSLIFKLKCMPAKSMEGRFL